MYLTIRCDTVPGHEKELDRYLVEKAKPFWSSQPGVRAFRVFADALVGWPERTILIEMENLSGLEHIIRTEEAKRLRSEFMTYTTNVQSQILDEII